MRTYMLGVFPSWYGPNGDRRGMLACRFASVAFGEDVWDILDKTVPSIRRELKRLGHKGSFDLLVYEVGDYTPGTKRKGPNKYPRGSHKGGMPRYMEFHRRITIK